MSLKDDPAKNTIPKPSTDDVNNTLQQDFFVYAGDHTGRVRLQNHQYVVSVLDDEEIVLYKAAILESTTPFIKEMAEHEITKYFKEQERAKRVLRLHAEE